MITKSINNTIINAPPFPPQQPPLNIIIPPFYYMIFEILFCAITIA